MPAWFNLPNCLTLSRLVLVPVIIQAISGGRHILALALFALAAFTDTLDGAAARRLGSATQIGAYLDPIADKCLLSGVFLALAFAQIVPWWFVGIVLGRDIYILLAVLLVMAFSHVRRFPPSVWGKVSTFVQICTVVVWMAADGFPVPVLHTLAAAILWPCVGFTIWSGLHYTWIGVHTLSKH